MNLLYTLLKAIPIIIAAILLGNLFLNEVKKSRTDQKPWYAPYITLPGLLIILAVLLVPIISWIMKRSSE